MKSKITKICFLAGAKIHTRRWAEYFVDNGYEVDLISQEKYKENDFKKVKLHLLKRIKPQIRIISFPINLLFYVIQTKRIIKKINPSILHSHFVANYGIIGALTGFHPFIVTVWGSDILLLPKKSRIIKVFVKFALKKADLITCSGENLRDAVVSYGINPQKIKLISHGVDLEKFQPQEKDRNLIKKLSIFSSPTIISIRNFEPVYNIETLIRSIPLILEKIPDAKFIIAGRGTQEKYLKNLAKSLGILDSIRFVGWIAHNELPKYFSLSDIYVSTSLSDGLSISLLEAISCKIAPVVTDIPASCKIIKDKKNGFIFPIKDTKSLAEKVIFLLKNKNIRKKFGNINRKMIEEKEDYYKCMAKMEKIYKNLI